MSDSDSYSSTDSDLHSNFSSVGIDSPYFEDYLQRSSESSTSDSSTSHILPGPSNDRDVLFNESESFDDMSYNSDSTSVIIPISKEREVEFKSKLKHKNWHLPNELYNREIGFYKTSPMWGNKFYQSIVAIQKLKLSKQLKEHNGCVNSLDFNSTGDLIASGSDDLNICLWNWSKGTCLLKHLTQHTRNIFQTKFLPVQGDERIVSSGRDGLIILMVVRNAGIFHQVVAEHDRSCNKLAVHQDHPYVILSCGEDGLVKSIDIRERQSLNLLSISDHGIPMLLYSIDINPMKSCEFIVNGSSKYVRMYDKRNLSQEPVKKFNVPDLMDADDDGNIQPRLNYQHITSAVYNYCGTEILASYSNDDIYLFETYGSSDEFIHCYSGHLNKRTIKSVNFYGPRSDYVMSGSDCGNLFIWDKKTEAIVQMKNADENIVNVVESHPYIPTLATSGIDKTIKIWEPLQKTCKQPNKHKLRMLLVKNRAEKNRSRSF